MRSFPWGLGISIQNFAPVRIICNCVVWCACGSSKWQQTQQPRRHKKCRRTSTINFSFKNKLAAQAQERVGQAGEKIKVRSEKIGHRVRRKFRLAAQAEAGERKNQQQKQKQRD